MSQTIVNLALPVVTEKINTILQTYPWYSHQQAFISPDLRQKLTAYVLSRMPGLYVSMDNSSACSLESPVNCYSQEQHREIDQLIHQGIEHLLSHALQQNYQTQSGRTETLFTPSSWFG
ncbi:MAG TPA: hypothetical protein V6D07_05865 [Trichocoleus sp.]